MQAIDSTETPKTQDWHEKYPEIVSSLEQLAITVADKADATKHEDPASNEIDEHICIAVRKVFIKFCERTGVFDKPQDAINTIIEQFRSAAAVMTKETELIESVRNKIGILEKVNSGIALRTALMEVLEEQAE